MSAPYRGRGRHRRPPKRSRVVVPGVVAVVLLGGGGAAAYAITNSSGGSTQPAALAPVASPAPTVTAPTASATLTHATAPVSPPSPAPTPSSSVGPVVTHKRHHHKPAPTLVVDVVRSSTYLKVSTASGHVLTERIVGHGHHLSYPEQPLYVVVGNAGAVKLTIHGHRSHHVLGRPGQVKDLHVR